MVECGSGRASMIAALESRLEMECGLLEFVPGAEMILLLFEEKKEEAEVLDWLAEVEITQTEATGKWCEIAVRYDGVDLVDFAKRCGLSREEVVAIHSEPIYEVSFMGFAPGFPYLSGLDPRLHLPRKDVPVPRIVPGSVAVGGSHAGIYSVASPGGWYVLGLTETVLFDPEKEEFLLSPGDRVKFKAV